MLFLDFVQTVQAGAILPNRCVPGTPPSLPQVLFFVCCMAMSAALFPGSPQGGSENLPGPERSAAWPGRAGHRVGGTRGLRCGPGACCAWRIVFCATGGGSTRSQSRLRSTVSADVHWQVQRPGDGAGPRLFRLEMGGPSLIASPSAGPGARPPRDCAPPVSG